METVINLVYITLEEFSERKLLSEGQSHWIEEHDNVLMQWIDENIADDIDGLALYNDIVLNGDPVKAYVFYLYMWQKETLTFDERFTEMCEKVQLYDGGLNLIIGPRRTGKTALAYSIAEYISKNHGRDVWWLGPPAKLPKFIVGQTMDMDKVPEGALVIVDEASLKYFGRDMHSEKQKEDMKKLGIISHTSRTFLFLTQAEAIVDITILRQATSLIFTAPTFLTLRKQRLIINEHLNYFMPKRVGAAMYFDGYSLYEINFGLPAWWNNEYSKPYSKLQGDADAFKFILLLLEDTEDAKAIVQYLGLRSYKIDEYKVQYIKLLIGEYGHEYLLSLPKDKLETIIKAGFDDLPINDIIAGRQRKGTVHRYNFVQDDFLREYWKKEIEKEPGIENMLKINKNRMVIDYIKRSKASDHVILSIYGQTGSRKSSASISLAECMGKLLGRVFVAGKNNIAMLDDDFLELFPKMQRYDVLIRDEQPKSMGATQQKTQTELGIVEETLRVKQVSYIFNGATVRTHLHRFLLETYAVDEKAKVIKLLVRLPDKTPIGCVTLRYASAANWQRYGKLKEEFTSHVQAAPRSYTSASRNLEKWAEQLVSDKAYLAQMNRDAKLGYIMNKFGIGQDTGKIIRGMAEQMRQQGKGLQEEKRKTPHGYVTIFK